jgi:hypothetical protein
MTEHFVVPGTQTWSDGDLRVALSAPPSARGSVPLLVLLDGQTMFLTATEYSRTVRHVTMGALDAVAVLGVWRETSDPMEYVATRFRDFTPYEWTVTGPFEGDNAMATHGTGGAGEFLDLLVDVVLPSVRQRADIGEVSIGGWSLSGLFAAWAWRERPDVFTHLVAISPSLWWSHARMLTESIAPRPNARAFISAGEHEEGDVALVWPQVFANAAQRDMAAMVRNAVEFGRMCSAAGAATETVVFPGEHHVTLAPASIARAVQHLYGGRPQTGDNAAAMAAT